MHRARATSEMGPESESDEREQRERERERRARASEREWEWEREGKRQWEGRLINGQIRGERRGRTLQGQ